MKKFIDETIPYKIKSKFFKETINSLVEKIEKQKYPEKESSEIIDDIKILIEQIQSLSLKPIEF